MFKPDERNIYQFHDRKGPRSADPVAAYDAFLESIGDTSVEDLFRREAAVEPPPGWPAGEPYFPDSPVVIQEAREARRAILKGIRAALRVTSVDEDPEFGLSEVDTFRLWFDMIAYMNSLKKSTDATPSSPPPTGSGDA